MKLLVTDYDNTFHINDNDMDENVHAVRLFMDDNLFAIATGRNYTSFMEQKELYDIPFNYLITNNGATIIKNGDVIYDCFIEDEIKNSILKTIDFSKIEKAIYCNGKDMVTQKEKLSKIYFKFYDKETAIKVHDLISNNYDVNVFLFEEVPSMDIVSKHAGKEKAIAYITSLENPSDVYVIGDSINDYEMIKKYKGYCSVAAKERIKQIAKKEYDRVSNLIYEIMEGKE